MAGRSVVAGIVLALAVGAGPALASDFARYQPEDRFGAWLVLCDSEDDMAAITYFDCVVQSDTLPAVVLSSLTGTPAVSLATATAGGRLVLTDRTIIFDDCPDGLCPLAPVGADLGVVLAGATVRDADGTATLSGDGLADAIDLSVRLPD